MFCFDPKKTIIKEEKITKSLEYFIKSTSNLFSEKSKTIN